MSNPTFFDAIPSIALYDPLGDFLGAFEQGEVAISYRDCALLAGHSCPTVATAFLMARIGLEALYSDTLPERSRISVTMRSPKTEGVTGVIGNVIAYIVGANGEGGFKGIGGKFARNDLLKYGDTTVHGDVQLTRLDTGATITLSSDTSIVPGSPEMKPLMQKSLQGKATTQEQAEFKALWQGRVETMLTDSNLWSQIVTVS